MDTSVILKCPYFLNDMTLLSLQESWSLTIAYNRR